jgi:hypothetical protein
MYQQYRMINGGENDSDTTIDEESKNLLSFFFGEPDENDITQNIINDAEEVIKLQTKLDDLKASKEEIWDKFSSEEIQSKILKLKKKANNKTKYESKIDSVNNEIEALNNNIINLESTIQSQKDILKEQTKIYKEFEKKKNQSNKYGKELDELKNILISMDGYLSDSSYNNKLKPLIEIIGNDYDDEYEEEDDDQDEEDQDEEDEDEDEEEEEDDDDEDDDDEDDDDEDEEEDDDDEEEDEEV